MPQQVKEYKKLMQTGVFFAPVFPQLGFLLLLIHLWFKRADFVTCIRQDVSNKATIYILSALSILAIISTLFTIVPVIKSIEYLVYVILIVLGYYSVRLSSLPVPDLLKPYIYAVSIETIFGIFQWAFHIEKIAQVGPLLINIYFLDGNRISSIAGHPMVLAGLATFAFLFSMILFIHYKSNIRYLYLALGLIAFVAELLTQSRGNFLAMLLGMSFILFVYYHKKIVMNVAIIALVIGFVFLFGKYQDKLQLMIKHKGSNQQQQTITDNKTVFERFKDKTGSGRLGLWEDTITLIKKKPVFGYGPDSWQTAMKNMVGDKYGDLSDAHNTFLRLSVDFGIPFAVIFVLFILYKLVIKFISSEKDIFTVGLSASLITIMFLGILDNPISSATITTILI